VIGSLLFGIGWGLVGLCPGPALENLAILSPRVTVFVVAMTGGMVLHGIWSQRRSIIWHEETLACLISPFGRRNGVVANSASPALMAPSR
jgi:uncharacterized membrane protein YedE/YeeE